MRSVRAYGWAAVLLITAACGSGGGVLNSDGGTDARVPSDARVGDAQVPLDGNTGPDDGAVDSGVPADGSVFPDGSLPDGSILIDSSVIDPDGSVGQDASVAVDGGTTIDGGTTADSGTAVDAGEPDAGPLCANVDCSGLDDICAVGVCNPSTGTCMSVPKDAGTSCSDGLYCTTGDKCDGAGACVGRARSCTDALNCTTDTCNENTDSCEHALQANRCFIGGRCYNNNSANAQNSCESCQVAVSQLAFSPKAEGANCNDRKYCTVGDTCQSGVCTGTARGCGDGKACTTDSCNEQADRCDHAVNMGSCLIDNMCVASGTVDPDNQCMVCDPGQSTTAWSPKAMGETCDDGAFCTVSDVCDGAGACVGANRDCGDGLTCTDDVCNEGSDSCTHEIQSNKCLVGGTCFNGGNNNPSNDCERCYPADSQTTWSPRDLGLSCGGDAPPAADNACDGTGMCVTGCNEGFDDCDNDLGVPNGNGCETTLGTASNCLACGNTCGMGQECTAGGCKAKLRIFVTSNVYDGDFDGVNKADLICQGLADGRGLGGVWQAWLSSGTSSAASRFLTQGTVPYVLLDGTTQVADDWTDLTDGTLDHAIDRNEVGGTVTNKTVWTGTRRTGAATNNHCNGFDSMANDVSGTTGSTGSVTTTWTEGAAATCNLNYRMYCVEQ